MKRTTKAPEKRCVTCNGSMFWEDPRDTMCAACRQAEGRRITQMERDHREMMESDMAEANEIR